MKNQNGWFNKEEFIPFIAVGALKKYIFTLNKTKCTENKGNQNFKT